MKKTTRKLFATIMAVILLCSAYLPLLTVTGYAADGDISISPYYVNCTGCSCTFSAAYGGQAHVSVTYSAKSDAFTYAKLTVKIQKRVLGIFWSTVDIGEPDNEWVAYCYDVYGSFYNSFPLESTGTYRAVFTVEFHGTSGEVDVIEDTIESAYE